jgi:hypothetical protein
MTWEQCRDYGLIIIQKGGSIELHYDMNYFLLAPSPNLYMTIESANWQGNSVIVRGRNQYSEPVCYILRSIYKVEQIF